MKPNVFLTYKHINDNQCSDDKCVNGIFTKSKRWFGWHQLVGTL